MKRWTLRRRVYSLLVRWLMLFLLTSGFLTFLGVVRFRQSAIDDRLLLARTVAQSLDATVSAAARSLDRLPSHLPAPDATAHQLLRAFRFQSPFDEATYILDASGSMLVSDPDDVTALPVEELTDREKVTALVRKTGAGETPTLAIVNPYERDGVSYFLVAEMNPVGSLLSRFLQELSTEPELHIVVIDEAATVIASSSATRLFENLPEAGLFGERIAAKRSMVSESLACVLCTGDDRGIDALTVMIPLRAAAWGVVIQQRRGLAFSALSISQYSLLLAGLLLALTGVFLSRALSRSVVDPIGVLSEQAQRLQRGELNVPLAVEGDHEIEVLAASLDGARRKLSFNLSELKTLNEDLESKVRHRTQGLRNKYEDLKLLHTVSQLSSQDQEPDKFIPPILEAIVTHYSWPAVELVTHPLDGASVTYTFPVGATPPPSEGDGDSAPGWVEREVFHQGQRQCSLRLPCVNRENRQVIEALEHQLAVSLHGSYLWNRTRIQDEQRRILVRRLLDATEEERRRIARELHDETAQLLTVIQLSLDSVPVDTNEIRKVKRLLSETQKEIHRIIYDLRPAMLDDLGLAAALRSYAKAHLIARGIEVSFEIEEDLRIPPEIQIATFRIYQEIVTNILRHAQAEQVSIELYATSGKMILVVEDDGRGFTRETHPEGAGTVGMRERASLVNGSIRFESESGMGASVILTIPLDEFKT